MSPVVFETERLSVRQFHIGDGDHFFSINGDPEIMKYIRPAKSRSDCDRFFHKVLSLNSEGFCLNRFAVDDKATGNFVGSFALLPIEGTDKIQLGYALLKNHWGKGYATELTQSGSDYFFQYTAHPVLYAITIAENTSSGKLLLRCGFAEHERRREDRHEIIEFIRMR
jgi:RimJ/RimL family protein N-acetyltransferase